MKEVKRTITVYEASDGTEFTDKEGCVRYEAKLLAPKVYKVVEMAFQGDKPLTPMRYFSTIELADKHVNTRKAYKHNTNNYTIVEVILDVIY